MKKNIILFTLLLLFAMVSEAQSFDQEKMDQLFQFIEKNDKGMGSIAIFKDGLPVYKKSIGFADIEKEIKAMEHTKYRIGSISKTFTAVVIMQLIEEEKLALNTPLSDFFPDLPNAQKVTVEHLLKHRSGYFNFTAAADLLEWMQVPQSRADLMKRFMENGTIFEPNEKMEYSNTNYVLLAWIAEDLDQKEFPTILQERIIKPSDLKHTYYGGKINTQNKEALSYDKMMDWTLAIESDMSVPSGAGAVVSTPSDVNVFLQDMFNGKLISAAALAQMKTMEDGYGLGVFELPFYDKMGIGHNGAIDGFQSMAAYFAEEKLAITYLGNGVSMSVNDILLGALSIYFGKDYKLPEHKPTIEVTSEALDAYLGIYSSPSFPLKITVTNHENILMAQATGQGAFPLEAFEKHKFRYELAGIELIFKPEEKEMTLRQAGQVFVLRRE